MKLLDQRFNRVAVTTLLLSLPFISSKAFCQSGSSPSVSSLQQLAAQVDPSVAQNALSSNVRFYLKGESSAANPPSSGSSESAFDVYVDNLTSVGWTQQADDFLNGNPDMIRNFQMTDDQANAIVSV